MEATIDGQIWRLWPCRKCGLTRTNKLTHVHGEPIPEGLLKEINETMEKAKVKSKEKAV